MTTNVQNHLSIQDISAYYVPEFIPVMPQTPRSLTHPQLLAYHSYHPSPPPYNTLDYLCLKCLDMLYYCSTGCWGVDTNAACQMR